MISSPSNFFSVENLHKAYLKCRKGKRGKIHTRGFEIELYQRLNELSLSLQKQSYKPSRSVCFYVSKPKLREIFAADFGDRVVHRLLIDLIEPYYEKKFITDSFACRKEKGTHRAVLRLKEFIRIGTNHSKKPLYYLQLDIKGFFMEIDKRILCSIIEPEIDQTLQWLCKTIICHNPTKKFIYRGKVVKKGILPPHKTLFHEDENKGIPIGNLTSQFFANVYLNELDQFIKRGLGIKYYIRYVDDFLILHENPEKLMHWKEKIIQYLYQKLKLTLKDDVMPLSVYKGIDFLRIPRVLSRFSRFRFQIRYYMKEFSKHLLIVQVGKFFELYGAGLEEVIPYLPFKPRYRGQMKTFGIPIKKSKYAKNYLKDILKICKRKYITYLILTQSDEQAESVKIRMPRYQQQLIHPIQLELFNNSQKFYKYRRNKNV